MYTWLRISLLGFKELYASKEGSMLFGLKYLFEYKKKLEISYLEIVFPIIWYNELSWNEAGSKSSSFPCH